MKTIEKFYIDYAKVPNVDEYEREMRQYDGYQEYVIMFQKLSKKQPAENYKFLIDQIKNKYIQEEFAKIIEKINYTDLDLFGINSNINKIINDVDMTSDIKEGFIYEDVQVRYELLKNGGTKAGIPTGFSIFDRYTGGLNKKELYLFFGRSGIGKTRVLFNFAYNLCKRKLWGIYFSLEMYKEQMDRIFDSRHGSIPSDDIKYGRTDKKV